jgi:hypothetical protein
MYRQQHSVAFVKIQGDSTVMDLTQMKLSKLSNKHVKNKTWPVEKRIQVVSQYLILGNMALVSAVTGVPHGLIRIWKGQPWWKDIEAQVRATENLQMDTKLSKIVDKSLDAVLDRVENGDFFYDQKAGVVKRKPVNMRDVARVSVDILSKRELLRGNATERKEVTQVSIDEQLKALALEFTRWQSPPTKKPDTIDVEMVEVLEEGSDAQYEGMVEQAGEYPEDEGIPEEVETEESFLSEGICREP